MAPSQSALANRLNDVAKTGRVAITENGPKLAVSQMSGAEAEEIWELLERAGWTGIGAEDDGGSILRDQLDAAGSGVRVSATRPPIPEGIETVLTGIGFAALLEREPAASIVWVEGLNANFDTLTVRYSPWGSTDEFYPVDEPPDPRRFVRVIGNIGPGTHLGRWMLRASGQDTTSSAIEPWRRRATTRLLRSLANELEPDGSLLFRGPPPARFEIGPLEDITPQRFATVQSTVSWTFENAREIEHRHALISTEIARAALRGGNAEDLAGTLPAALEGAKIAYGFGIAKQSQDTLKALGDLRKAVSDDAAKLSETTRTLGAAIVGAVFGNIGLIVARLTLPTNAAFIGKAAVLLSLVLAVYVAAIIGSGWHYIAVQRRLRNEWRDRLYRFLPKDEYKKLVEDPIRSSEVVFFCIAVAGALMVVLLGIAVYFIVSASPS